MKLLHLDPFGCILCAVSVGGGGCQRRKLIFTSLKKYPNANAMKKEMEARRFKHVRLNHVFFKKVSRDEEVVSRGRVL